MRPRNRLAKEVGEGLGSNPTLLRALPTQQLCKRQLQKNMTVTGDLIQITPPIKSPQLAPCSQSALEEIRAAD